MAVAILAIQLKWTGFYLLRSTGILEVTTISSKATTTCLLLGTPPDTGLPFLMYFEF